jgi:hypothetical protein
MELALGVAVMTIILDTLLGRTLLCHLEKFFL